MSVSELILKIIEYIGIAAFSISGATVGAEKKLDIFGCLMLGCFTSVGGGFIRDITLGITPPAMFIDPTYVIIASVTSVVVFFVFYFGKKRFNNNIIYLNIINITDAAGLGIFSAIGVRCACMNGYLEMPFITLFIGTLTGVGGGTLRDLFSGEIPMIFRKNIYAIASLTGSVVYYLMYKHGIGDIFSMSVTVTIVLIIRILAAKYRWNMPRIK